MTTTLDLRHHIRDAPHHLADEGDQMYGTLAAEWPREHRAVR